MKHSRFIEEYGITSSYELSDIIAEENGLQKAEITCGMNGYPSHLRGCVLLNDSNLTFEEMEALADKYGVEIVELRRKDGWHFYEEMGVGFELFDYADYLGSHNDNVLWWNNYQEYGREILERAKEIREYEEDDELAEKFEEVADKVDGLTLPDDYFVWVYTGDMLDYETSKRHVDGFWYDTWSHVLALDCSVE